MTDLQSRAWIARIAGRSPSIAAMPLPMACSTCWRGRNGTPTGFEMICATTSSTPSAIPARFWSLTYTESGTLPRCGRVEVKGYAAVGLSRTAGVRWSA